MQEFNPPITYAVWHKDEITRLQSRSGGVFTALSDFILDNGGVVYGCCLTDELEIKHIRAERKRERDLMRGSKYAQSTLGDTFKEIKKDLNGGKSVLFTGTSCQVAGLKNYIGDSNRNLLLVDIVCHGVPSPLIFSEYIRYLERKRNKRIVAFDFRNKNKYGWRDHVETIYYNDDSAEDSKVYTTIFYDHNCLRPCCYVCKFKKLTHPGDITIADYWGVEKAAPQYDDNKGTSLVMINTIRGEEIFDRVREKLVWQRTSIEDSMQPPFYGPFSEPKSRERFWREYKNKGIDRIIDKISRKTRKKAIVNRFKKIVKKIIGR